MGLQLVPSVALSFDGQDRCLYDVPLLEARLCEHSKRLFVEDDDLYLQVLESGKVACYPKGPSKLNEYLEQSTAFQGLRIINVHQQTSIGHLTISEKGLRHLLSWLDIFPAFLNLVHCFGKKDIHAANTFVAPLERTTNDGTLKESCFLLSHVEHHERDATDMNWSVRQMGVYMQSNQSLLQHSVILLNPIRRFCRRYLDISKTGTLSLADVETLLFSTCFQNWSSYMDDLEKEINIKIDSAFATSISNEHTTSLDLYRKEIEIKPSDVHDVAYLRHKVEIVSTAIESNAKVLGVRASTAEDSQKERVAALTGMLGNLRLRCDSLQEKLSCASALVKSTLEMKNTLMSLETTNLARQDTVATLDMQKSAVKDSRVLKTIAILTLLYLPASFVAQLLSMDYIHVSTSGPIKLNIDGGFVVFIILTIALLLITALIWLATEYIWKRQKNRMRYNPKIDGYV